MPMTTPLLLVDHGRAGRDAAGVHVVREAERLRSRLVAQDSYTAPRALRLTVSASTSALIADHHAGAGLPEKRPSGIVRWA